MNRLSLEKRAEIVRLMVEGNSLRSCCRIANVSLNTVTKLLVDVGKACLKFHSKTVVRYQCKRVQCDEIWAFVGAKRKNITTPEYGRGDVWTWVAMDADTKFVISWFAGERDQQAANFFMNDLWARLKGRVQLTTDGYVPYKEAVADTFGSEVDFAQLVKRYNERDRYMGADKTPICGKPDKKYISTSFIERQNLTMRMQMRRFTRRTNAYSKKIENHCYAIAINFVYYNFVRVHSTLRVTPAMEAKIIDKPLYIADLLTVLENYSN